MIPTLILFGLVFGRWWRASLVAAAFGWPLLLVLSGTTGADWTLTAVGSLAVVNTLVGVLVHQATLWSFRRVRPQGR